MSGQHNAKFTWGSGPQSVYVAGGFNNWSGDATPLHKQADGTFSAEVPMPWGEKQAFKYVVDGEWKVREDEAKEWDAAGNMNNVYTAPPAPLHETAPAPTPAPAAASTPAPKSEPTTVPAATSPDVSNTSAPETAPSTLLASSAPASASKGPANTYILGGVASTTSTSTPVVPVAATQTATTAPTPVVIEKTAATAPIGEAGTTAGDSATAVGDALQNYGHQAAEYGAAALGVLGGLAASAAVAVEKATGVDLTHSQPLSIEEAKARGIDVDHLPKVDAPAAATSPVGTVPPASAVDALEEKVQALKVNDAPTHQAAVPLPNGSAPKTSVDPAILDKIERGEGTNTASQDTNGTSHDIGAQSSMGDNHKHVPMPVITNLSAKDPAKDRSLDAVENRDSAGTKPIASDPAVSAKEAKKEAELHPDTKTGSTPAAVSESKPVVPAATASAPTPVAASTTAPVKSTTTPVSSTPVVPAKEVSPVAPVVPSPATTTAAPPATPAKTSAAAVGTTPISTASTPATTPVKNTKESTNGSDVKKRKSGFFGRIKNALSSPKDKSK